MTERDHLNWREVVDLAFERTAAEFRKSAADPGPEEYVGTFRFHYDEIVNSTYITMWPVDPAASGRRAESRAANRWGELFT